MMKETGASQWHGHETRTRYFFSEKVMRERRPGPDETHMTVIILLQTKSLRYVAKEAHFYCARFVWR